MVDKKAFEDYFRAKRKKDGSLYKEDTITQYLACLNVFFVPGFFKSVYELDEIDSDNKKLIEKQPFYIECNIASKGATGAAFNVYYSYLKDNKGNVKKVESEEGCANKLNENNLFSFSEISLICDFFISKGFSYSPEQIVNFYLALKTKPFVLLAGISGTGKTRLARLFAEAVGAIGDKRYLQVAVKPDWSDSSDIFGYKNLKGEFEVGEITKFIAKAMTDLNKPYFLVLDEMNLARVEYYFSDFLSLMETRDLHDDGIVRSDSILKDEIQPWVKSSKLDETLFGGGIYIPQNLYVIGTVNMDESTFPFSKKVLDRAITIEFNDVDLHANVGIHGHAVPLMDIDNSYFLSAYHSMIDVDEAGKMEQADYIINEISKWNDILKKAHLNIGYRVRNDVLFYSLYASDLENLPVNYHELDYCMMQKILPRIQGSSQAIKVVLTDLNDALGDDYPMSKEKIRYMLERYNSDGFTAFWL